jgi:hypothetical protein
MLPKYHVVFGFFSALIISLIFNLNFFYFSIIFLSSILIDLDHYFRYIYKTKNFSPKKFWEWSMKKYKERKKDKPPIFIFHGIESWILLIILSFFNKIFLFIFLGFMIHMILDYVDLYLRKESFLFKFSQTYVLKKNFS